MLLQLMFKCVMYLNLTYFFEVTGITPENVKVITRVFKRIANSICCHKFHALVYSHAI